MAIGRYHRNAATLFTATSAFFARDNVALPGVALNFKVIHKFFQRFISNSCILISQGFEITSSTFQWIDTLLFHSSEERHGWEYGIHLREFT